MPPNGQGIVALLMLALLDDNPASGDPLSPDCLQTEIEAARLAYAMRDKLLADPDFAGMQIEEFLSPRVVDLLRGRIRRPEETPLGMTETVEHTDTVYIAVVDRDRMAVSFINSLFNFFGSGILAPEAAFCSTIGGKASTLILRIRTRSRRASGRCTRSFPAC